MDEIRRQVAQARRRLTWELFLQRLTVVWAGAFAAATVAVLVPKIVAIESLPAGWGWRCFGVAAAAGLAAAGLWTLLRGRTDLDAAMEIDRRYQLRERLASSLSLDEASLATPAGQALLADARRAASRVNVAERFRIDFGRRAWWPVPPLALGLFAALLLADRAPQRAIAAVDPTLSKQQLDNAAEALRKRLVQQKEAARKQGLKDAEQMLLELEKRTKELSDAKTPTRQQALLKLNDLKQQLAERRQQLGGDKELRQQLAGMKDMAGGPADKMMQAMKQGDWQQARQELSKLANQLADGKLDETARKQIAQQVAQLQKKLDEAAAQRKQAMKDLQSRIADMMKQGNLAEAGKLQQKLDQLAKQNAQSKQMQQMANQLGQLQQALAKGDGKGAAQQMEQLAQQMSEMASQAAEGEMLDMAMEQLEGAKESLSCSQCQGEGCSECQGGGKLGSLKPGARPGRGMGQGVGAGARPEEKTATNMRDSRVKQDPRRGAAVIAGEADGPAMRGDVQAEIAAEMASQGSQPADPLTIERLPRTQRENAEQFFNSLREAD